VIHFIGTAAWLVTEDHLSRHPRGRLDHPGGLPSELLSWPALRFGFAHATSELHGIALIVEIVMDWLFWLLC